MNNFKLSNDAIQMVIGSSKGTQPKYYENGYWYKKNRNGYEGTAEYLSSLILSCSNTSNYVEYEKCLIDGAPGCRSKNFLNEKESFISFERLFEMATGGHLEDAIRQFDTCAERIEFVKDFIEETTGVDCSEYLSQILTLDALTLNCDRHFNNLGIIIENGTKIARPAPIFDNGDAFLSNFGRFSMEDGLEENIEKAIAKPFSTNHLRQALDAGIGLKLDYDKLYSLIEQEKENGHSRAFDVLEYQIEQMHDLIPAMTELEIFEKEVFGHVHSEKHDIEKDVNISVKDTTELFNETQTGTDEEDFSL